MNCAHLNSTSVLICVAEEEEVYRILDELVVRLYSSCTSIRSVAGNIHAGPVK